MIKENLEAVKHNIHMTCQRSGRDSTEVTLIAVSKTKPVSLLLEAYQAGIREFGENKVQELLDKYDSLPKDIKWHLIGHLQRNKVKYIVDKVYMIHGVDSLRLAQEISKEAIRQKVTVNILIQVNIAKEDTKFGVAENEVCSLLKEVAKLPNITICGLMMIAPYVEDSGANRIYFRRLKQLSVDIIAKSIDNVNMNVLSMGMSGDYIVAMEEGATYIRVGTNIFGGRIYHSFSENE